MNLKAFSLRSLSLAALLAAIPAQAATLTVQRVHTKLHVTYTDTAGADDAIHQATAVFDVVHTGRANRPSWGPARYTVVGQKTVPFLLNRRAPRLYTGEINGPAGHNTNFGAGSIEVNGVRYPVSQ
jgi:hypothetical protein